MNRRVKYDRHGDNAEARHRAVLIALLLLAASPGSAQQAPKDLADRSLEDLMNVEVTSVSKTQQPLSRTAAAVYVITQEDIRRSGATRIPDLLRMVPGLDVGEINGSTWAISARGFSGEYSNKLLVLLDGRIVYTPNFAGVYWDTLDVPLEDIDRIEVIRGPGGSIWGANAVNGVISIFTKKASDTQGGLVVAGGGNIDGGFGTTQWGGKIGNHTDYRVFMKYFNQNPLLDLTGQNGYDGWHVLRGGFRTDSQLTDRDSLTVIGSLYDGREDEKGYVLPSITSPSYVPVPEAIDLNGGFVQARWDHTYSPRADSGLQVSYWRYSHDDPSEPEKRDTLNIDYQDHLLLGSRHDLIWGLGYEFTADRFIGSLTVGFNPPSRTLQVFNTFLQDSFTLVPDRLQVTAGLKVEHNDYTGFEWMPSGSVAWMPDTRQTVWASVSRAMRTPSRNDTNLIVNIGSTDVDGTLTLTRFLGNSKFQDERLIAFEAGYRSMMSKSFSLDASIYLNKYDNAQTTEPSASSFEPTPPPPHEVDTLTYENLMFGETHGIEADAKWQVTHRWTLRAGYALELLHMHTSTRSEDTLTPLFVEHGVPRHSAQLRSHVSLARAWEWDSAAYFVDRLSNQGILGTAAIPAYTRIDTMLTWRPLERLSISGVGQNLQEDHHLEYEDFFSSMQSGEVRRSAYAKVTWQF